MKLTPALSTAFLLASLAAQSPLSTLLTGGNGLQNGGMVFFNLTATVPAITVNRIDVNSNSAANTIGRVRVWQTNTGIASFGGSEFDASRWTVIGEGDVVASGSNLPTVCCLQTPFTLTSAMGSRGYAIEHIGIGPNYTNYNGAGMAWQTAELALQPGTAALNSPYVEPPTGGGSASNPFLSALAGGGAGRLFNGLIHYVVGTTAPACSSTQRAGLACGGGFASWFHVSGTTAMASAKLQGKTFLMVPNANGAYDVHTLPATALIPYAGHTALGGFVPLIPGWIGTNDGETVTPPLTTPFVFPGGVATSFFVHTNGMISAGSNLAYFGNFGGFDWAPHVPAALGAPNAAWFCWHDFDITTAGAIRFDDNGSQVVITWDAVPNSFGAVTDVSTIQTVFDRATGTVSMTFQTVDAVGILPANYAGNSYFVGYSPGGSSLKPQYQVDTAPFSTQHGNAAEAEHFSLQALPRPVVGSTVDYNVANLSAAQPLGLLYFSVGNPFAPGLPLQAIGIGKPACMLNFDLANAIGPFSFASAGTALSLQTGTVTPSLVGLQCWSQALTFDLAAPDLFASLTSSNALLQLFQID